MKSKRSAQAVSVALIHFRGIKPAAKPSRAPDRLPTPTVPRAEPEKRIKFAGIGGGGRASRTATAVLKTEPAAARIARQRRTDALLDQTAAAAGLTPKRPA